MKKTYLLLLSLVMVTLGACALKSVDAPEEITLVPTEEKTTTTATTWAQVVAPKDAGCETNYFNKKKNFQVTIPADWKVQEDAYNSLVRFFSPQEEKDPFREDIGITIMKVEKDTKLDDYAMKAVDYMKDLVVDFVELENKNIKIDGIKAKKVVYAGIQGPHKLKWQQVIFIKDNEAYTITFTASSATYSQYVASIDTLVKSFDFK